MENTRLFKIIIIIVWRTQDIKVFSSTNAARLEEVGKAEVYGVWLRLLGPYRASIQESAASPPLGFEAGCFRKSFDCCSFCSGGWRETVSGVRGGFRGLEVDRSLFLLAVTTLFH